MSPEFSAPEFQNDRCSPLRAPFLFVVRHWHSDEVHSMRLACFLGKLRGPCLRLALARVGERRNLLGLLVNDSPNEFHTLRRWRGLSGAGRLSHNCFWFLLLGLYRSFLGHPFNPLPVRQSLRHGIIRFSGSPDRTSCVPILYAGLYQIYRGLANRFNSFGESAHANRPRARSWRKCVMERWRMGNRVTRQSGDTILDSGRDQ
jgi:hypothetical protein